MSRSTQRELVLELLADGLAHTTLEFIDSGVLRAGARVHELRQEGYAIETRRVDRAGRSPIFAYRLQAAPGDVDGIERDLERMRAKLGGAA